MRRRLAPLALAATALGALALARGSGGGPALYDGICAPVSYTQLGANPGPLTASKAVPVSQPNVVDTGETAPQAQIILPADSFPAAAGASVQLSIKAVAPPAVAPADGTVDGNVYRFSALGAGGAAVDLNPGHPATIALEVTPSAGTNLAVERFDHGHWTHLTTVQSGCGTTQVANTTSLGDFALVSLGKASGPAPAAPGGGAPVGLIVALVAVFAVGGGGVLALRRQRLRRIRRSSARGRRR